MSVKTSNLVDPRIEPQAEPVYTRIIGPKQNQFYKINASSLSNSSVTFNNLTTLGVDRAYLDTFEVELTAEVVFENNSPNLATGGAANFKPDPDEWTFDSFPFAKCCEQVRVNINGGAFFSTPLSYVRAKERYWCEDDLSRCYENVCPIHKPHLQYENGQDFSTGATEKGIQASIYDVYAEDVSVLKSGATLKGVAADTAVTINTAASGEGSDGSTANPTNLATVASVLKTGTAAPTRLPIAQRYYGQTPAGLPGGTNNSIVRLGKPRASGNGWINGVDYERYYWPSSVTHPSEISTQKGKRLVVLVTWREPIFCSPFSSRIDATYGRPLYNITSMDVQFNLCQDLSNMIRVCHLRGDGYVTNYSVNLKSAQLCYQVMTIPPKMTKPITTLVPYRRFVPYISDFPSNGDTSQMNIEGTHVKMTSGVYTLNEIPQAIWIFCAPTKSTYQANNPDIGGGVTDTNMLLHGNWASNRAFAYLTNVDITMANTTQILSTAAPEDLYRIAKANGCCDSYQDWGLNSVLDKRQFTHADSGGVVMPFIHRTYDGIGSVLRLIPGADIVIPDQDLIPAANASNMVIQVRAEFDIPKHSLSQNAYSLWLLFEYVGVAAISPGQCEITMNPLGNGAIFDASPIMSVPPELTEGKLEGSGFLDGAWGWLRNFFRNLRDNGTVRQIIDTATNTRASGSVQPPAKKLRGGAVMGLGDFT